MFERQGKSSAQSEVALASMGKQAPVLFEQLAKALEGGEGQDLVKKIKV